jgi:predicted regulator of Ras-like GTPase activity (Roadblock/LC7/MglB family)
MIFQAILESLLQRGGAFRAAVLLDHEGETVVAAHRAGDDHDHRVVGAYQGIFLRDLSRAYSRCGLGPVDFFAMDRGPERIFTKSLIDGYYVVLLADRSVPVGLARHALESAAGELREQL